MAVGDPEQLHQVNDTKTTMEQMVEQSPCRSIFPPWPWPSVIRSSSTRGTTPPPRRDLPMWSSHRAADLPVVAVVVVDPEHLDQVNNTKTTME